MKVSVILPTHNRPDLLNRAIDSVIDQTYDNIELLIVDDSSETDTESIVEEYNDCRIRYFEHEQNQGPAAARNTGIEQATGDYIAFLDDDDEWRHSKLEKQVPLLEKQPPDVGLVYCWMNYYTQSGELVREYHPTYKGYVFPHVLDGQRIGGCPTLLVRQEVVQEIDGFDESLRRGDDGDFIRRICKKYNVAYISEVLVNVYTEHGHERLTSMRTKEDIQDAINSQEKKLEKFPSELDQYPSRKANVLASLGYFHSLYPNWGMAINYYIRALMCSPTSPETYSYLSSSVGDMIYQ